MMTAFEYLKVRIPNLSETDSLCWRNPDYVRAVWRKVADICVEMEQFAADVIQLLRGLNNNEEYSGEYMRAICFDKCFSHIVQTIEKQNKTRRISK